MLKRTLVLCALSLLLGSPASARVHRRGKFFPANHESVMIENQVADEIGAHRYFTQAEVDAAVEQGELSPFFNACKTYVISPALPKERRFALPVTVGFVERLSVEFYGEFEKPLMIDSAVRPATVQHSLLHRNHSAAPAYGPRASSHERGTTVDISRRLSKAEYNWMMVRLLYYHALGQVLVIEEKRCIHIFVRGEQV